MSTNAISLFSFRSSSLHVLVHSSGPGRYEYQMSMSHYSERVDFVASTELSHNHKTE